MTLIQEEPKVPARRLLLIGIPSFILAVAFSLTIHQYIHLVVYRSACGPEPGVFLRTMTLNSPHTDCPVSSLAATATTLILALASFALYMRFPNNLLLGSMAFVNASTRLPETLIVSIQLLFTHHAKLVVDESTMLKVLHMKDPTAGTVLLCFLSLVIFFLTITIVHDTKRVPSKWLVAVGLFLAMVPLETVLWPMIMPIISY